MAEEKINVFSTKKIGPLEYLKLSKFQRAVYKVMHFIYAIPKWFWGILVGIGHFFAKAGKSIANEFKDVVMTFKNGGYETRVSYLLMGFGNAKRGQIARGILFFAFEAIFIVYMILAGGYWLKMMPSLGTVEPKPNAIYDEELDTYVTEYGDNSFKILLYSVLTIFFIIAFIYVWRLNVKQNKIIDEITDQPARKAVRVERNKKIRGVKFQQVEELAKCGDYNAVLCMTHHKYSLEKDALKEKYTSQLENANDKAASKELQLRFKDELNDINLREKDEIASLKANKANNAVDNDKILQIRNDYSKQIKEVKLDYKEQEKGIGKPLKSGKDDVKSLIDDQFHKTLLALPVTGIIVFTVLPIVFMILVAFTNYDGAHNGWSNNLFHWVGWENFNTLLNWSSGNNAYSSTFGEVLAWTLIWAFFATFSNYFLGMLVAIMINKKGIKFKKVWRTVLVLTIAIPQFISLLYVSKMFAKNGIINGFLSQFGVDTIDFFGEATSARITVILINIWIGIPYLMLIATGILMNIPEDLYESSKIDGANAWQQYMKITLPYMLFITGPYLLTSFTGNMNNFNVIFFLTGGGPTNAKASTVDGTVGYTDLLITWLFKITQGTDAKYYMASVVGILVFIVVAVISLVVYNVLPSNKNEEDFQ